MDTAAIINPPRKTRKKINREKNAAEWFAAFFFIYLFLLFENITITKKLTYNKKYLKYFTQKICIYTYFAEHRIDKFIISLTGIIKKLNCNINGLQVAKYISLR